MTKNQYLLHAAIMSNLRARFLEYWDETVMAALQDSEIEMKEHEKAKSMHDCWTQWRKDWWLEFKDNEKN